MRQWTPDIPMRPRPARFGGRPARARFGSLAGLPALLFAAGCSVAVERPDLPAPRMIDPPVGVADQEPVAVAPDATRFRLLGVEAADPIRYRVLHRSSAGELTEDAVWSWSTLPSHLLATAVSQGVSADPDLQMVETATAPAVAVRLLSWFLEDSGSGLRLVGAVEVRVTDAERSVLTSLHEAAVPVSRDLPGDLAVQAAQLLRDLASSVRGAVREAT